MEIVHRVPEEITNNLRHPKYGGELRLVSKPGSNDSKSGEISSKKVNEVNINFRENTLESAPEEITLPEILEIMSLIEMDNDEAEKYLSSLNHDGLLQTRQKLDNAAAAIQKIQLEMRRQMNVVIGSDTIDMSKKSVLIKSYSIKVERLIEIFSKVEAEQTLIQKYGINPNAIISKDEIFSQIKESDTDFEAMGIWLSQAMGTCNENISSLEAQIKKNRFWSAGKKNRLENEMQDEIKKRDQYRAAFIKLYSERKFKNPPAQPLPEYKPKTTTKSNRPVINYPNPIPSHRSINEYIEKNEATGLADTVINSRQNEISEVNRLPESVFDAYDRWQDMVKKVFDSKKAYPDPMKLRDLMPTIIDIFYEIAKQHSSEPAKMIEWTKNSMIRAGELRSKETWQQIMLHDVFDEAMAATIIKISNSEVKKIQKPDNFEKIRIIRANSAEEDQEVAKLKMRKLLKDTYGKDFSLNNPNLYKKAFLELAQDVTQAYFTPLNRAMTKEEKEAAALLLQQMAERAYTHLESIQKMRKNTEPPTASFGGKIARFFSFPRTDRASQQPLIGKVGESLWVDTCKTIHEVCDVPLRSRIISNGQPSLQKAA